MTIGVKYCGGCNPRYDRPAEISKVKESYSDITFESYNFKKEYDRVLLVCGCERMCLKFRPEYAQLNTIIVNSVQECREVIIK